jgi:hypothetical protein
VKATGTQTDTRYVDFGRDNCERGREPCPPSPCRAKRGILKHFLKKLAFSE